MELLNVIKARTVWLFDINDLNPKGKHIGQEFIKWLAESYKFSKVPSSSLDLDDTKALAFLFGGFGVGEETITIDLRIYPDGAVADSRSSTDHTDAFLKNVLELAEKKFGLTRRLDMVRKVIHLSELSVRCKHSLSGLNPKLKDIALKLSSLTGIPDRYSFDLFGIGFWNDPQFPSGLSHFRIEKTLNVPASENRYYSVAPLKTSDHLAILDELEKLLPS